MGVGHFVVAGPAAWNSLSDDLCDPTLSTDSFRRLLKTHLFSYIHTAHERYHTVCAIQIYDLLTYLLIAVGCWVASDPSE